MKFSLAQMPAFSRGNRFTFGLPILGFLCGMDLWGCGEEGSDASTGPVGSGNKLTAVDIGACPNSDNLITSALWMQCLAGKTAKGTDPVDPNTACEVRFLANHSAEFTYGDKTYAVLTPARWETGLYQNHLLGTQRQMMGSLTSDTIVTDAIHEISVSIVTGAYDDNVKIQFFDASLKRKDLNCKLEGI